MQTSRGAIAFVVRSLALAVPALVGWLLHRFGGSLTQSVDVLVFVLIVIAVAAMGDRVGGVLAALSSALWFEFFLVPPVLSFSIDKRDDMVLAVLMVVVGIGVTELAVWGIRQDAELGRQIGIVNGLAEVASSSAAGVPPSDLEVRISHGITAVLGAERCTFVPGPVPSFGAILGRDGEVSVGGSPSDVARNGLPVDQPLMIPVFRHGEPVGSFRVVSATRRIRPSRENLRAAILLADQLGNLPLAS